LKKIPIKDFCEALDLEIWHSKEDYITLSDSSINRPGLQLYGFFEHFDSDRVQLIGKVEISYLRSLHPNEAQSKINDFFSYYLPCLIVCWGEDAKDLFLQSAIENEQTLLVSKQSTTKVIYRVINYLDLHLAPLISMHAVLVEIFGVGVLITGSSGIGKSETALEIVKRGHCLIADDVVEVKRISDSHLVGEAPDVLKYFMEIRGIGVIDVATMYGVGSVKESNEVDMVIKLQDWNEKGVYDRLGLDETYMNILGIEVPEVIIPVSSGRNLSSIIETAAINNRTKKMGINSAQIFCERVIQNNVKDQ
jgi:HPr kinase/phosphorylase